MKNDKEGVYEDTIRCAQLGTWFEMAFDDATILPVVKCFPVSNNQV